MYNQIYSSSLCYVNSIVLFAFQIQVNIYFFSTLSCNKLHRKSERYSEFIIYSEIESGYLIVELLTQNNHCYLLFTAEKNLFSHQKPIKIKHLLKILMKEVNQIEIRQPKNSFGASRIASMIYSQRDTKRQALPLVSVLACSLFVINFTK